MFDFELIKSVYGEIAARVDAARQVLGRPMTLCEKIFYAHLSDRADVMPFERGVSYVNFAPDRVAMQDATAQMALLQFINSGRERVALPSSVHCDHLIIADKGSDKDINVANDVNREVYDFLASVSNRYGIGFWRPGAGIIHQVVLENYAFPGGMIIGSDSHTPNAGGLGMIAIGVGGADVTDVMAGMAWELRMPKIIGVRLTGALSGWATPKDVILTLAGLLTVKGATNAVIEYFGSGCSSISATGKATICNMGAEVGATCSIFPYDSNIADYLRATSRAQVADAAQEVAQYLVADQAVGQSPERYYDRVVEIDLSKVEPHLNGPFTPDLAWPISKFGEAVRANGYPQRLEVGLIGSCTNSSYEDMSLAANLARQAVQNDIEVRADFIVNPGSEQVFATASRDGIIADLESIGAQIMANACGPCIGQWDRGAKDNTRPNSIVTSFNRNFAKRADGNPNTYAFVASPVVATALAIAGDLCFNPITDTLVNRKGEAVKLVAPTAQAIPTNGIISSLGGYIAPAADGSALEVRVSPDSKRLQLLQPFEPMQPEQYSKMQLLIKAKGKCTTDHISMAGVWLKYRGHLENISENLLMGAVNAFNDQTNSVLDVASGEYGAVSAVAKAIKARGGSSIVVAQENYGEGSSREHAAMEPRFLSVKTILAQSFARIHETNLKKQGMLALTFARKEDYDLVREDDRLTVVGVQHIAAGHSLKVLIEHSDGTSHTIDVNHTYNDQQIGWLRAGAALNIKSK